MSRVSKYKESIIKFLDTLVKNKLNNDIFIIFMKDYDFYIPIVSLTIQYNTETNKKNFYGYYIASIITLIEFVNYLTKKNYNENDDIVINTKKLIFEIIEKKIKPINKNISDFIDKHFYVDFDKIIKNYDFPILDNKLVYSAKYNFDDIKIQKKYDDLNIIDPNYFLIHIQNIYGNLCKMGISMNLLIGKVDIEKYKKIIHLFGLIIKVGIDFKNFMNDINQADKICANMLVNIGIQKTFNLYLENKSLLIESCITNKLYTHTIKEIFDQIDNAVDSIINNSSITIESTYEKP
jgi:hypothetical protein